MMQGYWTLTLIDGETQDNLIIFNGNFQGNADLAIKKIEAFCNKHKMSIEKGDWVDYLIIDGKEFSTNRFGLNIEKMLCFCDIDLSNDSHSQSQVAVSSFNGSLFHHSERNTDSSEKNIQYNNIL